jgi:thymidylate synthase
MKTIEARNVNQALQMGLKYLIEEGKEEQSRAGNVLVAPVPVMTVTRFPQERVLFSSVRDANPFFHLREAMWMLAGGNKVKALTPYVSRFVEFAEPDGTVHGAYGHRWRHALGFDQLEHVINVLKADPMSRQCIIQMWDARDQYQLCCEANEREDLSGENDLRGKWKDRPCNTHIYLRIQPGKTLGHHTLDQIVTLGESTLDLTVCCRSNDAVWGAHGANAVHFSILQEYLAARIGVGMGKMYQLSNNYHAYLDELDRLTIRGECTLGKLPEIIEGDRVTETPEPLFDKPDAINKDIQTFETWCDLDTYHPKKMMNYDNYENRWFETTLMPAMLAHERYKKSGAKIQGSVATAIASALASEIRSMDWRIACTEWLQRRKK